MGILLNRDRSSLLDPSKKAGREALEICLCISGAFLLRLFVPDVTEGILPASLSKIGLFGHKGFVCPLCGGTRAFVLVTTLSFASALHCSLLGTCVAFWLYLTLPVRLVRRFFPECRWSQKLYPRIKRLEHPYMLLILMAVFLYIQLYLHYFLDFPWIPLSQLYLK